MNLERERKREDEGRATKERKEKEIYKLRIKSLHLKLYICILREQDIIILNFTVFSNKSTENIVTVFSRRGPVLK